MGTPFFAYFRSGRSRIGSAHDAARANLACVSDFRKLDVWQKAHALAIDTHRVAVTIKGAQYLSMRSQIIRAAISIPAKIVEGCEQQSKMDFARFLRYSVGSSSELESHLQLGFDLEIMRDEDFQRLLAQIQTVRRMLHGLIAGLSR